ncbi:hypothetical protein N692_03415 [Lactiplantibacillus plantarum EGD-AQ4]|nr:hypothetical protein N692_03415 [Lactiplantibacillus plantarum EGD-AQ4]
MMIESTAGLSAVELKTAEIIGNYDISRFTKVFLMIGVDG